MSLYPIHLYPFPNFLTFFTIVSFLFSCHISYIDLCPAYKRKHRIFCISCHYSPLFFFYPPFFRLLLLFTALFYLYVSMYIFKSRSYK